ncbi:MAG: pyruvate, phosphate dikinase [Maritimibacter sp.]|nr:pyruvate, phosphate dikinase [Maritimibacter sp.]
MTRPSGDAAVQKIVTLKPFVHITATAPISVHTHGGRAKCLQRLIRLNLPVPTTVALSFETVTRIAAGQLPSMTSILSEFGSDPLLSVRPSSEDPDWGGPGAILNIGMNWDRHAALSESLGEPAATALYLRFVQAYSVHVARLDPDMFEQPEKVDRTALDRALDTYQDETDDPFPQDPAAQLGEVLRSMARAWGGTTARLLRQAKGAPADAGLGLVVQRMALGVGPGESGAGVIQFVDPATGEPQITGRYRCQSQSRDALKPGKGQVYLTRDERGPSLEEIVPEIFADLCRYGALCREKLREEMQLEFTIEDGNLRILDALRVQRSSRAAVRIAVALADDGIIPRSDALLRIAPRALTEVLHPQIDPTAKRVLATRGIGASPGAARGKIVFSSTAAQASAARDEPCILVRRETAPEDVRGMHAARGILTERGGMTSHAAVIARGLGLPCVVGASSVTISHRSKTLTTAEGKVFAEGDEITLDGGTGEVLAGAVPMLEPALDDSFRSLLSWADAVRDIGIRANADTPADARLARSFAAQGIGLCRTEHMFFEQDRLTVMREMIFAKSAGDRAAALEQLLPMQRADFVELFEIMQGLPVCIRLFDPPLHEFLPTDRSAMRGLAESLDLPIAEITRRVEQLTEFNPMLGMRGVRLGIAMPEIYEMQARAIFEATIVASRNGDPIVPEIMIPLVSANREVELVKTRIDAVAAAVRNERGKPFDYRLGVMGETPRACLRADEIAQHAAFMSFGTNDLTQMTYGLSRDDAGRFMSDYVNQGVFREDPFHMLDVDGVGELLKLGAERARATDPDIVLSICGEHAGNAESIAFCRDVGFDYVSCSPFRVPVVRLAAAHLALLNPKD